MVRPTSRRPALPALALLVGTSLASSARAARVKASEEIDWRKVTGVATLFGSAAPPTEVRGQNQELGGQKPRVVDEMVFDVPHGGHQVPDRRFRNPAPVNSDTLAMLIKEQMTRYGIDEGMLLKDTITILPGVPIDDQEFLREVILDSMTRADVGSLLGGDTISRRQDADMNDLTSREFSHAAKPDGRISEHTFVTVKRYQARNMTRTPQELKSLQNILQSISKTKVGKQSRSQYPFLKVYSATHNPKTLEKEPDAEVTLVLEPYSMSMRDYFMSMHVDFWRRCAMFSKILLGIEYLHRESIIHNSVVTPDNIFMAGDLTSTDRARPVLCPSVFSRADRICTLQDNFWHIISGKELPAEAVRPSELLKSDLKQAGKLLEWMVRSAPPDKRTDVQPFLVLAKSMKAGLFDKMSGEQGAAYAFEDIAFRAQLIKTYRKELEVRLGPVRAGTDVDLPDIEGWLRDAEEELQEITGQMELDLDAFLERRALEALAVPAIFSALQESEEHLGEDEVASDVDRGLEDHEVAQGEAGERARSEGKV